MNIFLYGKVHRGMLHMHIGYVKLRFFLSQVDGTEDQCWLTSAAASAWFVFCGLANVAVQMDPCVPFVA
jgi:hypothetical protein